MVDRINSIGFEEGVIAGNPLSGLFVKLHNLNIPFGDAMELRLGRCTADQIPDEIRSNWEPTGQIVSADVNLKVAITIDHLNGANKELPEERGMVNLLHVVWDHAGITGEVDANYGD
eukprot:gene9986-20764_t